MATPAAPQVLKNGFLTLRTKPWTKVFIDGKPHGSTPLYRVELAPGKHTLHLENEQMDVDVKKKLVIKSGETTKLDLSFAGK